MDSRNSISVIIPTFNEEENIKPLVKDLARNLKDNFELIFIDDHSTDNTEAEIKKMSANYPIKLQFKKGEQGKTFSLKQGFELAKSNYLVMIDADLQYPPSAIHQMLELIINDNADIVVANRKDYNASFSRKIQTDISRFIIEYAWHLNCDTQSGLKVFKKEVLKNINITTKNEWTFDIDFLVKAKKKGYRIGSFDINFGPRKKGESKINPSFTKTIEVVKEGIRLRFNN